MRISRAASNEGLVLPLFIKKYEKGHFTRTFLQNEKTDVEISHPRGRGMSLSDIAHGKIVIFAGGTGFYPFCDLIDLLFKRHLVEPIFIELPDHFIS